MTIRLLTQFDIYPSGAIVSLSPDNEAGLIRIGAAEADLTGGTPYDGPRGEHWVEPALDETAQA